jgi:cell division protein FtsL
MRLINFCVICALILAAVVVYKIKFDSTLQAERVAKLHAEIRKERNAIALLRAEWSKLDAPNRIQELAKRHLSLRALDATQFDDLRHVPMRPEGSTPTNDPIGAMLAPNEPETTASVPSGSR